MRFAYSFTLPVLIAVCVSNAQTAASVDRDALEAIESAQRAVSTAPESEENVVALASIYLKFGQNPAAEKVLQSYLQPHPNSPKSQRLLALAYLREGNYAKSEETAEHALQFGKPNAATMQVLGMAEIGLQAPEQGEKFLREAVRLDPGAPEANFQLGLLLANERKDLPEAIRLLEKAASLQPKLASAYTALGSALLSSGNAGQAVNVLTKAISLDAKSTESYYTLAKAYRQLHQDEKAETTLARFDGLKKTESEQRALEMRSRADYEAGVNLLSNTDDLDKAYDLLAKSVQELPAFDPGYYRMAQASYLKGDLGNAVESIRRALRLNPLEPEYYFVLARCLEDSDPQAAMQAIEKAITFHSGVSDFEELQRELRSKLNASKAQ